jgi:DNA polymerase III subunit chi
LRADFYHLTRVPLEKALPSIAERILANGERLVIVAEDEKLLTRIDALLWSYKPESFLPHGREGDQPILLSADAGGSSAQNVALIDGHWRDAALSFGRAFYFFDSETRMTQGSGLRGRRVAVILCQTIPVRVERSRDMLRS